MNHLTFWEHEALGFPSLQKMCACFFYGIAVNNPLAYFDVEVIQHLTLVESVEVVPARAIIVI